MDVETMRYVFETFELQSDLKEACRDWDRPTSYMDIDEKKLSIEIQRNQTDPSALHRREQANTVLERVNAAQEEQQLQQTVLLAQTDKIQEQETRLAIVQYDQEANSANSVAPSILGRVPALISTGDTTLTRESREVMFKTWTATQVAPPARTPRASGTKKMSRFGDKYIPNEKPNGERTLRLYPN